MRAALRLVALAALLQAGHTRSRREGKAKPKPKRGAAAAAPSPQHAAGARLLGQRRLPEALDSFDEAIRLAGTDAPRDTRVLRSQALAQMGKLPEALAENELALEGWEASEDDPRWFGEQWFMRGILYQQLGPQHLVESVEAMRTAHRLGVPDNSRFKSEVPVSLCVSHAQLHALNDPALRKRYLTEGIAYCDEGIAAGVRLKELDTRQAIGVKAAHFNKGMILFHLGRGKEAWAATDASTELIPTHKPVADAIAAAAAASPLPPLPDVAVEMHALWPAAATDTTMGLSELPFHSVISAAPESQLSTPVWVSHAAGSQVKQMNAGLTGLVRALREQCDVSLFFTVFPSFCHFSHHFCHFFHHFVIFSIISLRRDPRGNAVSNVGGWQSKKTPGSQYASFIQEMSAQDAGGPARALHAHILGELEKFLAALGIDLDEQGRVVHVSLKETWVNVNDNGHWNQAHNHLTNTFSGIWYIDSGCVF